MPKKCIICSEVASLVVKGTSDFYCQSCAEEHFDDLSYLSKIADVERMRQMEEGDDEEDEHATELNKES